MERKQTIFHLVSIKERAAYPQWMGCPLSFYGGQKYQDRQIFHSKIYHKFQGVRGIREPAPDPPIPPGAYSRLYPFRASHISYTPWSHNVSGSFI